MTVKLNQEAFLQAKGLIKNGGYTIDTEWSSAQPSAEMEDEYIEQEGWSAFSRWYLGLDADNGAEDKINHQFPYGDFKTVHRSALVAARQGAAELIEADIHPDVEEAVNELLSLIDEREGSIVT